MTRGFALLYVLIMSTIIFLLFAALVQTQYSFQQQNERAKDLLQQKASTLQGSIIPAD